LKLELRTFNQALQNLKDSIEPLHLKHCLHAIEKLLKCPWILGLEFNLETRIHLRQNFLSNPDSFVTYLKNERIQFFFKQQELTSLLELVEELLQSDEMEEEEDFS